MGAMSFFLLAVSAVAPSFLLVWYFQVRDLRPERARVIWATFGLGFLLLLPLLLFCSPLAGVFEKVESPYLRALGESFLLAAIPEELLKFLVVALFAMRLRDFDEPMDGVVYAGIASLGFATFENMFYLSDPNEGGWSLALARALTSIPAHASFGAVMGYFVGKSKFSFPKKPWFLVPALLIPIVLHGFYNFPILCGKYLTLLRVRREVVTSLTEETFLQLGMLPALLLALSWAIFAVRTLRKQQIDQAKYVGDLGATEKNVRRKAKDFLLLILGGILVSAAGMVLFGLLASMASAKKMGQPVQGLGVAETLGLAALSALGGGLLFYLGVRRLRPSAVNRPAVRWAPPEKNLSHLPGNGVQ